MMDQAKRLRQIVNNIKSSEIVNNKIYNKDTLTKIITVTSGKGGVGKTNVTINLAIALSDMGYRVTIIDADFGLANIDVLFGIVPQFTLADVINNKKNIFDVITEGPNNIKFISGGSGVEDLIKLTKEQLDIFLKNVSLLDENSDIILIDTGAGLSDNVMSFVMAADEVILVTTPEPTSITDAYALIKMVSNKDKNKIIKLIVNKAESESEGTDLLNKLSMVTEKFLKLKVNQLGYVLEDSIVTKAVKLQSPFMLSFPKSSIAKQVTEISKKIINFDNIENNNFNSGIKGFISKLVNFLKV